ncbi:hypothetical protein JXM67_06280 [candidate division WOR-3 bacterium]|nr:hypothetical protein [candidate division WOR-3 bacterium]
MDKLRIILGVALLLGVCGTVSADVDTLTAELGELPEIYDDITDWERFCLTRCMDITPEASTFLPAQGENSYEPAMMIDGLARTAWVEGRDDYGEGETVTYRLGFPEGLVGLPDSLMFTGFWVMNGYCKDETTWKANSRVKTLKLSRNGKPLWIIALHDVMYLQDVYFPELMWAKSGDIWKVEILEVYPGTKYTDTAISELMPRTAQE